jgi:two-component system, OmpR family, response regulator
MFSELARQHKLTYILCVDDEQDILDVAKMCLEVVGGYKVTCCSNSVEAFDFIEKVQPDLILLDVMMPQLDGPTFLKNYRAKTSGSPIPIIFITARVRPGEVDDYLKLGANGVLAKPFDPMTLASQVSEIWESLS